nr:uncharacterized protein LOC111414750 [Onthophagus taurus]
MKIVIILFTCILCHIPNNMGESSTPSPTPQVMQFFQVIQRLQKYMLHPKPREVMLITRELLPDSTRIRKVDPIVIIVNECPKFVGLVGFQQPCVVTKSKYLEVHVTILNPKPTNLALNVEDHIECSCESKIFSMTTSQIFKTSYIPPTIPTINITEKKLTNSGDVPIYFSKIILIITQLFLVYLFI